MAVARHRGTLRSAVAVFAAALVLAGLAGTAPLSAHSLPGVVPLRPAALAVGPNGNVYMVDRGRNEVLERLPDGRFVVVAGDGRAGFSGDGGPATRAELNYPGGIVFGPGGVLYVADTDNNRVREILPDGEIRTVVGDGRGGWAASGELALRASVAQPAAVAIGPTGRLVVAAEDEVVELGADGRLVRLAGIAGPSGAGDQGLGGPALHAAVGGAADIAFDRAGSLFIACLNIKWLGEVTPQGRLVEVSDAFYPRGYGLVVKAPAGTVFAANNQAIVRLGRFGVRPVVNFADLDIPGVLGFLPNGLAVDARGDIYADTFDGNGWSNRSALVEVLPDHQVKVLWRS
jgi:hypothetical protein